RAVLEVKRERHGVTQKRRVWVPRTRLQRVIRVSAGLRPVLAVTYRRHVYQATRAWRVTVDRDIGFHPITAQLALSETTLTAERLEPAVFTDRRVVVEVKHLGDELPPWLAALQPVSRRPAYSKFLEGMARVHAFAAGGVFGG